MGKMMRKTAEFLCSPLGEITIGLALVGIAIVAFAYYLATGVVVSAEAGFGAAISGAIAIGTGGAKLARGGGV
jgi:hypothetical protein